jgi:hypothetical protein
VKSWLTTIVVAVTIQACTVMDGEHERIQKKTAAAPGTETTVADLAGDGAQPTALDGGAPQLHSGDAGPVTSSTVECGGKSCSGATPFACAAKDSCTCVDTTTASCTGSRFLMRCDSAADCGTGQVCCSWWDGNPSPPVWESACVAASACKTGGTADKTIGVDIMCFTNEDCPVGSTCIDWVEDWNGQRIDIKAGLCTRTTSP